jgi:hypothetical protein
VLKWIMPVEFAIEAKFPQVDIILCYWPGTGIHAIPAGPAQSAPCSSGRLGTPGNAAPGHESGREAPGSAPQERHGALAQDQVVKGHCGGPAHHPEADMQGQ